MGEFAAPAGGGAALPPDGVVVDDGVVAEEVGADDVAAEEVGVLLVGVEVECDVVFAGVECVLVVRCALVAVV